MKPEYAERTPASILRAKWQVLRSVALIVLTGGALLTVALLAGIADPTEEGAIVVEFRSLGAADSAVGIQIETTEGDLTILITRDGYLSMSTAAPDWHAFPHIADQRNRLLLKLGDGGRTALLYINGERAWQGETGTVRGCRLVTRGDARVEWLLAQSHHGTAGPCETGI